MKFTELSNRVIDASVRAIMPGAVMLPFLAPLAAGGAAFDSWDRVPRVDASPAGVLRGALSLSAVPRAYDEPSFAAEFPGSGTTSDGEWVSSARLDARAASVRQIGLESLLGTVLTPIATATTFAGASAESGPSVVLEWGLSSTIALQPSLAGQQIPIFLRNNRSDLEVGGLDLKFGLSGGSGPYPSFTGMDLRAASFDSPGSPFRTSNSVQGADANNTPQLQFWSVSINDPFNAPTLPGGGVVTQIGVLTLSTVGVTAGSWGLSFRSEATALTGPFGDEIGLTLRNANLSVIPEPTDVVTVSAALLLGVGWLVRRVSG